MLFGQVIYDVAFLVNLAALDEGCLTRVSADRRLQCLAAIQNIQTRRAEIQAALQQIAQQRSHYRCIFGRSFAQPQHRFAPVTADAQCHNYVPILEGSAVVQCRAQP